MLVTPSTAKVHGGDVVEVREHPPADAGVDVAADAARGGERGDLGHRVDDAVGVRRRGGDDEDGRVVDGGGHRGRVGAQGPRVDVDDDRPGRRGTSRP